MKNDVLKRLKFTEMEKNFMIQLLSAIDKGGGDQSWFLNGTQYNKQDYYKILLKKGLISEKKAFAELL